MDVSFFAGESLFPANSCWDCWCKVNPLRGWATTSRHQGRDSSIQQRPSLSETDSVTTKKLYVLLTMTGLLFVVCLQNLNIPPLFLLFIPFSVWEKMWECVQGVSHTTLSHFSARGWRRSGLMESCLRGRRCCRGRYPRPNPNLPRQFRPLHQCDGLKSKVDWHPLHVDKAYLWCWVWPFAANTQNEKTHSWELGNVSSRTCNNFSFFCFLSWQKILPSVLSENVLEVTGKMVSGNAVKITGHQNRSHKTSKFPFLKTDWKFPVMFLHVMIVSFSVGQLGAENVTVFFLSFVTLNHGNLTARVCSNQRVKGIRSKAVMWYIKQPSYPFHWKPLAPFRWLFWFLQSRTLRSCLSPVRPNITFSCIICTATAVCSPFCLLYDLRYVAVVFHIIFATCVFSTKTNENQNGPSVPFMVNSVPSAGSPDEWRTRLAANVTSQMIFLFCFQWRKQVFSHNLSTRSRWSVEPAQHLYVLCHTAVPPINF